MSQAGHKHDLVNVVFASCLPGELFFSRVKMHLVLEHGEIELLLVIVDTNGLVSEGHLTSCSTGCDGSIWESRSRVSFLCGCR